MIDVDVLRAMYAAGASIESIFAAIEADQAKELTGIEKRRDLTAERMRRLRSRRKSDASDASRDDVRVTNGQPTRNKQLNGFHCDASRNGALLPFLDSLESKKERKIERGGRLPETWVPSGKHFELGASLGMSGEEVLFHGEALREWADGNANRAIARKANWDKAFNGWLRRERQSKKSALFKPQGITVRIR